MILAEKIMEERKKNGWSQEELAEKLSVSRQAVSKWESAQSIPDLQRVIQLSEILGVSTDYLLKDECETPQPIEGVEPSDKDFPLKRFRWKMQMILWKSGRKMHRRSQLQLQPVSSVRQF